MGTTQKVDHKTYITSTLKESSRIIALLAGQTGEIEKVASVVVEAYKKGNKMVLFGNGGSAADSQHIAAELVGGFANHNRPGLPAMALTTNTSSLTAIGNDYSFETVFARQVEGNVSPGDVVVAISTSGNSANVIQGAKAAKKRGAVVIGMTGQSGDRLASECDYCLRVPSTDTAHIQEAHIAIGHILCALVEKELF